MTKVIGFHRSHSSVATLVLTKARGTTFDIGRDFRITEISPACRDDDYTFSGIAICSAQIFSYLPRNETFGIVDVFQRMLDDRAPLFGVPLPMLWYNINSHVAYWKIHHALLHNRMHIPSVHVDSPIYRAPSSIVQSKKLEGFVSIGEQCSIGTDVALSNTIVLPHSIIQHGTYKNCILSHTFCINVE